MAIALFLIAANSALSQNLYRRSPDYDLPMFLARLPQFCYAQYFDTKQWHNPQYSIIAACGVGMNHFCPALLNIMRAEYATNSKKFNRGAELRQAKENVDYTIARLQDSASCIYTPDIMAAKQRVNVLEKIIRYSREAR
jgi:hypothetical protein